MKITKTQLRRIIKEEASTFNSHAGFNTMPSINDPAADLSTAAGALSQNISSLTGAISAIRNSQSFSYTTDGSTSSELSRIAGPSGMISSVDPKIIMGIGSAVVLLILVAMALGYSVKVGGSHGKTSGEIIFDAPQPSDI